MKWPTGYQVSCSDDGRMLACLGRNVVVIDVFGRQRISTSHPISHPSHASFSPDGERLAVKSTSGQIVVVDPKSGEVMHDHGGRKDGEGSEVHFSPSGKEIIDGSWDGVITVRDSRDGTIRSREQYLGEMITRLSHDRTRRSWLIEHSPKARAGENLGPPPPSYLSVRQWPFARGTTRVLTPGLHIRSATLSPDGSSFCSIEKWDDRRVHVARVSDGQILAVSEPTESGGTGDELAWSTDSQYVGVVQKSGFVFYRATDLSPVGRVPSRFPSSIAFLPGGKLIALGSWEGSSGVKIIDVIEGAAVPA